MKTLRVSWTYLDCIEVPDDISFEEIQELLKELEPVSEIEYNDREWDIE